MRVPMLALLAGALVVTAATGCGEAPGACKAGETRPCYLGPAGTEGIGVCRAGTQSCEGGAWSDRCVGAVLPSSETCDYRDNDCNGFTDEGVENVCGGCVALSGKPGDLCGNCGKKACDGRDALKCVAPDKVPGSRCGLAIGCDGVWTCKDGAMSCVGPTSKNSCGLCDGPELPEPGFACTADGCPGMMVCNLQGDALVCNTAAKNNCGTCGAADVPGIGNACTVAGCAGKLECDAAGTGSVCRGSATNECGVCGGPPVTGLGTACTGSSGCPGVKVCNSSGTGSTCNAPAKNNCGACGAANVSGIGTTCSDGTCSGQFVCDVTGTGRVCNAAVENACGVCGGPTILGLGNSCSANGCNGQNICNAAGTGVTCNAPVKNNCGVCGAANVPGLGGSCTSGGCTGIKTCDTAGTGFICTASGTNNCGLCGGAHVPGVGDACTSAGGCPGILVCNATKNGTVCNAPASCGTTAKVVISEIAVAGVDADDEFVELYNPTSDSVGLAGWSLFYRSATGTGFTKMVTFAEGTTLPARRYRLIGRALKYQGAVSADETFGVAMSANGGSVWLAATDVAPSGVDEAIDVVGWGNAKAGTFEGTSAAPVPGTASIERKARASSTAASMASGGADATAGNGYDSNDNGADFIVRTARDPQNSASPAEP